MFSVPVVFHVKSR